MVYNTHHAFVCIFSHRDHLDLIKNNMKTVLFIWETWMQENDLLLIIKSEESIPLKGINQ